MWSFNNFEEYNYKTGLNQFFSNLKYYLVILNWKKLSAGRHSDERIDHFQVPGSNGQMKLNVTIVVWLVVVLPDVGPDRRRRDSAIGKA